MNTETRRGDENWGTCDFYQVGGLDNDVVIDRSSRANGVEASTRRGCPDAQTTPGHPQIVKTYARGDDLVGEGSKNNRLIATL